MGLARVFAGKVTPGARRPRVQDPELRDPSLVMVTRPFELTIPRNLVRASCRMYPDNTELEQVGPVSRSGRFLNPLERLCAY